MFSVFKDASRSEIVYIGIIASSYILTSMLYIFASGWFGPFAESIGDLLFDIDISVTILNLLIMGVNYIWNGK